MGSLRNGVCGWRRALADVSQSCWEAHSSHKALHHSLGKLNIMLTKAEKLKDFCPLFQSRYGKVDLELRGSKLLNSTKTYVPFTVVFTPIFVITSEHCHHTSVDILNVFFPSIWDV